METPVPYNPKGGRPKKSPEEKRTEKMQTHFTPDEFQEVELKATLAGMTQSQFLRSLALDFEISAQANPENLKSIRSNLGRITGLLNQIAAKSNSGIQYNKEMLDDLCDEIRGTLQEL